LISGGEKKKRKHALGRDIGREEYIVAKEDRKALNDSHPLLKVHVREIWGESKLL